MRYKILIMLLLVFSAPLQAVSLKLAGKPDDNKLHLTLLKEVVKRSNQYDRIEFIYAKSGEPASTRIMEDLDSGALDIMWTATSREIEQRFDPIYFPIYRGMLGMRIGLIHQKNAALLAHVNTLTDMKSYKICSGKTWTDTHILDANGLKTAKSLKYPNIFDMLIAGNRCDLFARGVMEPFSEMESYRDMPLAVDKHIMLRYKMPYMLFVRKGNEQLRTHLTALVEEIFNDGTYEQMFFNDDEVSTALSKANLHNRVVLDLKNPYLTKESNQIPEYYFYNPLSN